MNHHDTTPHPLGQIAIKRVRKTLASTLRENPEAIIETERVAQQTQLSPETAERLIQEFVNIGCLRTLYLWKCLNGVGTSKEAHAKHEFGSKVECDRCGDVHYYSEGNIEEVFEATSKRIVELASVEE